MIAYHIKIRDLTWKQVASALDIDAIRFGNLLRGITYPTPNELERVEAYFSLPAEVLFDPGMLQWRENWPPIYGAQAQMDRDRHEAGE
jgi:hypothetical protein